MKTGGAVQSVSFPPIDWERAKAILTLAADLPQEERTLVLETQLSNDPTLSTTVLTLLQTYDKTMRALGPQPSVEQHEDRVQSGDQYGSCRVIRPLGHGGMGQVFLAEENELLEDVKWPSRLWSARWMRTRRRPDGSC